jgi:hypothetical protein
MPVELAQIGNAEFRLYFGRGRLYVLISASYMVVGFICIGYGYTHQVPYLPIAGIAVLSIGGLLAWLGALKRYRVIADTPTAMLRSAAQGYVELTGTCKAVPDAELLHYGRAPPCLWYMATIVEKEDGFGNNDTHTRFELSHDPFIIEDGTGECVIDPDHAEVFSIHQTRWREGSTRYSVMYLLPGDRLYAIGDIRTLRAADGTLDRRADLNALLREWKQDRVTLVQRFDINRDGDIDLREWQRAVTAAEREVDAQHREARLEPGVHVMRATNDGRPFLLSNRDPDNLRQGYKWWAWFHLTVFVFASAWSMALLLNRAS